MLDFLGKKWFGGLAVLAVIDTVWLFALGHTVDFGSLWQALVAVPILLVILAICHFGRVWLIDSVPPARRVTFHSRLALLRNIAEISLFLTVGWVTLRLFNHLSMTTGFPYADALLASWDAALFGLWNDYFRFVAERPLLVEALDKAYFGLTLLSVLGCYVLLLTGRDQATRFFIYSFTATAVIATTIGMFFPARAAVASILENPALLAAFTEKPGWYSVDIIEKLRTQDGIVFDIAYLPGLTTFPSFHTAAGVVLAYSFRGSPLFSAVCAYTLIMIASTPVFGGHYFVDLLAGAALALIVCRYFEGRAVFAGLFAASDRTKQTSRSAALSQ